MTDTKRILPWERNEGSDGWLAETKIATYHVFDDGYWYIDDREDGHPANSDLAIDACEADYIARCTEFLSLYDAKMHVVVSRKTAEVAKSSCIMCANGKPDEIRPAVYELRAALEVKE